MEPGKVIFRKLNFEEDGWPESHYSECGFFFQDDNGRCLLEFKQTGNPIHKVESLECGWEQHYWTPMKEGLENQV